MGVQPCVIEVAGARGAVMGADEFQNRTRQVVCLGDFQTFSHVVDNSFGGFLQFQRGERVETG